MQFRGVLLKSISSVHNYARLTAYAQRTTRRLARWTRNICSRTGLSVVQIGEIKMTSNYEVGIEAAIAELVAVQRAIAADNLDRRAAYKRLAHAREILQSHVSTEAQPPLMAAE